MLRFFVEGSRATLIADSRSGFKVFTAIGDQLRVGPDQPWMSCFGLLEWVLRDYAVDISMDGKGSPLCHSRCRPDATSG